MSRNQPMSMEAMLDQERRDVLALLEGHAPARQYDSGSPVNNRSSSPYTSPRSPVRSMLDVGDDNASISSATGKRSASRTTALPVRSMLDIDSPLPPAQPRRSMLDIDTPSPAVLVPTAPSSPVESRASISTGSHHPRSMSDSNSMPTFGPRASAGDRHDPTAGYQFSDILTNNMGQALPKRNTQASKFPHSASAGIMAEVMRGNDLSSIILPGDKAPRHQSVSGPSGRRSGSRGTGSKSKSPGGRGWRSPSPNVSGQFQQIPGTAVLDNGQVVDISNAYRKLSDANMAFAGGRLGQLAASKRSSASEGPGSGRLAKDYFSPDGEDLGDSSEDDGANDWSDDEASRGRKMSPRPHDRKDSMASDSSATKPDRKTLSLLAAAEEERIEVSSKQRQPGYRSLFDEPEITVTGPGGEKSKHPKSGVHPSTAFDQSPSSGPASVMDSDDEQDVTDIKRAQKLGFSSTPIISTPETHRAIRIIYRGEYAELREKAEEEGRRQRKYLVATDLSDESGHALEWTIGTVLRDGDTLLAIYCVDEETGIYGDDVLVPDETKAHREQAAALNAVATAKEPPAVGAAPMFPHLARASALGFGSRSSSPAPTNRERDRAEDERNRAVEEITQRVAKLLRKTKLQVRVIVEVLHCKNPKHLITEVIDLVSPTLVILGSRGRSALKGVILGSFSNYLVTKSSVPVMVARKRLRKQSKYRRGPMRQVNNLQNPATRSLANAKID